MFVRPDATLIAHTKLTTDLIESEPNANGSVEVTFRKSVEGWMEVDADATDAETLMEFGGRGCYLSWHKPNPKTAKNADYLKRTVFDVGHGSIAEHATASVYLTGVSRALTHELVRHRHLSYSQLSQRFVDGENANTVVPPALRGSDVAGEYLAGVTLTAGQSYQALVGNLADSGLPRKQAREAARAVLPNMVETRILVTGNLRTWAEVLVRRSAPDADAEFREVAGLILDAITPVAPSYFEIVRNRIEANNE